MKNQRRLYLIDKAFSRGLDAIDEAELTQLEEEVSHYIDTVAPLPTEALDRLEAFLEEVEARGGKGSK